MGIFLSGGRESLYDTAIRYGPEVQGFEPQC